MFEWWNNLSIAGRVLVGLRCTGLALTVAGSYWLYGMAVTYFDATAPEQAQRQEIVKLQDSLRTARARAYEQGNPPEARAAVIAISDEIQRRQQMIADRAQYRDDTGLGAPSVLAVVAATIMLVLGGFLTLAWW